MASEGDRQGRPGARRSSTVGRGPGATAKQTTSLAVPGDQLVVRDFGLEELTGGRMVTRELKAVAACDTAGARHSHIIDFQVVYVARGWLDVDFSDVGRVRLGQGAVAVQRPDVVHSAIAHSDDLLLIEIVTPSRYSTTMAEAPAEEVTAGVG